MLCHHNEKHGKASRFLLWFHARQAFCAGKVLEKKKGRGWTIMLDAQKHQSSNGAKLEGIVLLEIFNIHLRKVVRWRKGISEYQYIWAGTPFSGYFFVESKNPAIFGSEAPSDAACPLRHIKTKYFRRYVKKYSSPQDVSIIRPATAVSKSFLGYLSPGWCQLSHLSPANSSERPRRLNLQANYLTPILIS